MACLGLCRHCQWHDLCVQHHNAHCLVLFQHFERLQLPLHLFSVLGTIRLDKITRSSSVEGMFFVLHIDNPTKKDWNWMFYPIFMLPSLMLSLSVLDHDRLASCQINSSIYRPLTRTSRYQFQWRHIHCFAWLVLFFENSKMFIFDQLLSTNEAAKKAVNE